MKEDIRTYPRGFFAKLMSMISLYVGRLPLNLQAYPMLFYESGYGREAKIVLTSHFPQQTTRFVNIDIILKVTRWQPSRTYTLSFSYYRPDGSLQHTTSQKLHMASHEFAVRPSMGWGWHEPGYWSPGKYKAEICIDGEIIATDHFTIDPPPPPKAPDEVLQNPRIRLYASGGETIHFPQQTTREVICELTVRNWLYQQQSWNYLVTVQCFPFEGRPLWEIKRNWLIQSHEQEPKMSWSIQVSGWSQGMYCVDILIEGKQFAWGVFAIE
jgi:hypothetical protein